jgi:serine/threonine protein kinase
MTDHVGQRFGNYQVLRKLGEGGFAQVYLAEHQYLEIPAAIKVLHVRMGPETHERFRREARTIAHLQHPHIVRVLEFGIQEQTPYLVMEYAPGGTLRTRHPRGTSLPLEQIATYVKQIAPALDYAHQQHVIHRDIKPENMLLSAQQEVVLSDFGIAVIQPTTESLSTQDPAGTPLYMAPEQIRGKPCAASDQYALAVVVYEWLCGEPPFHGPRFQVYSQHLDHPPPGLGRRLPHLPPLVEDAVLGALAKDPQERFTSVQDFATVLEAACDATQPLVSQMVPASQTPEQQVPPNRVPVLLVAPGPREADRSDESTPLQPMAWQRTADEQEPGQLVTPLPVIANPTVSKPAGPSVAQRNRERLLRKVRSFWIAGLLEHSLHEAALIALGLQERPDAVATPWQLLLQPLAGGSHPLPAGTSIKEVYDAADGELLILGAPGSGKTTLLLELTRELLSRAEQDGQHPLPVVFPLSSWASKQQPLADWLVEELHRSYQVPRELGRAWVDADQILSARAWTAAVGRVQSQRGLPGADGACAAGQCGDGAAAHGAAGRGLPGERGRAVMGTAGSVAAGSGAARTHEDPPDAQYPGLDISGGVRRRVVTRRLRHGPATTGLRALCPAHAQAAKGRDALHARADHALAESAGMPDEEAEPNHLLS